MVWTQHLRLMRASVHHTLSTSTRPRPVNPSALFDRCPGHLAMLTKLCDRQPSAAYHPFCERPEPGREVLEWHLQGLSCRVCSGWSKRSPAGSQVGGAADHSVSTVTSTGNGVATISRIDENRAAGGAAVNGLWRLLDHGDTRDEPVGEQLLGADRASRTRNRQLLPTKRNCAHFG